MVSKKSPWSQRQPKLLSSPPYPQPIPFRPDPQTALDHVKAFFKYSETVALARTEAIVGFVTVVIGSLDWSPFFGMTSFDQKQVVWLGSISLIKGVVTEIVRRRNSTLNQV